MPLYSLELWGSGIDTHLNFYFSPLMVLACWGSGLDTPLNFYFGPLLVLACPETEGVFGTYT